jgi:hypothetical protein
MPMWTRLRRTLFSGGSSAGSSGDSSGDGDPSLDFSDADNSMYIGQVV